MNNKNEKLLREFVRKTFVTQMLQEQKRIETQEMQVRKFVRSIISEVKNEKALHTLFEAKDMANPHPSTGINKLRDAIRKAKPSIKSKFQQLTSSKEQRESFTNHLLAAFVRLFDQLDALSASSEAEKGLADTSAELGGLAEPAGDLEAPPEDEMDDIESEIENLLESVLKEIEIDIEDENDVVSDDLENEKEQQKNKSKAEKDFEKKKSQEEEREEFGAGIEGDDTGRNQAFDAFNLTQTYFSDNYLDLDSTEDRDMFKKWGLYNLKLLLDSYEEELSPQLEAPEIENPT